MTKVTGEKIMLGCGVVSVGGFPIGLTRGGSSFVVEREFRNIEADCDRGPVEGRVVIDTEVAKFTVNALEPFATDEIKRYYPGLDLDTSNENYDSITGTLTIVSGDYNDVAFVGKTKDGKAVTVEVDNALNLSNLELALEEKSEVVASMEFTGHYAEASRETPPWRVKFSKAASYTVTFTVDDGSGVAGATVNFYGREVVTNSSGVAVFASIPAGTNLPFTVVKGGYETFFGAVDVDSAEAVSVSITAL